MRQVAVHRFLQSSHIVALIGGSRQQILRRLQLLYQHGYLDRPRAQLDYFHTGGSSPLVYGLARRGAGRLRRDLDMPFEKMDWAERRKNVGRLFLEHALMVSDIMVAIECACRSTDGRVRFLPKEALKLPPKTSASNQPFRWSVTLPSGQRIGVIPDAVFALEQSDQPADRQRSYFFLEADRGTMPITRQNSTLSSFARKLQAYAAIWNQNLHRRRFGIHRFRVLTATTGTDRIEHLATAAQQLDSGRGLFLFGDSTALATTPDFFDCSWMCVDGSRSLLLAA
jgi:Replication-relaxation